MATTLTDAIEGGRSNRPRPSGPRTGPLRLGVVGCGAVAERYHLPAILASADVRAVMFADPVLERAQQLCARVPGARAVADHRALLEHVDLAVVAAPNPFHAPVAIDLLMAGVHVLVEKPMARTAEECERVCAAALEGRAVLAVGHDFRFFPVAQAAQRLLAQRALGRILRVDTRQSAGTRWPCHSPASLTREAGGGVLMNFGVHAVDLLLWWLGDLSPVHYADDAAGGVESECECELLHLEEGTPVHLEVSRRRALRDTTIVTCTGGTMEIGLFEPALLRITPGENAAALDAQVVDAEFDRAPLRTVFQRQLADVVAAIDTGRAPLVGGDAGVRAVTLVETCYSMRRPLRRPWDVPESYRSVDSGIVR